MQDRKETTAPNAEGGKTMACETADHDKLMAIYRRGDEKYRDALRELAQR